MRVNFESPSSTERKVEVFISAEDVKGKMEEVVKEFQMKAKVKGFRPGKIPKRIVEAMYGDSIFQEVSSRLVSESFEKALDENSVTPVSRPKIIPDKIESDKEFHYTAVFEVMPDFEPQGYTGIELKREKQEVKEEDVEAALNSLRENAAEAKALQEERELRKGDYAVMDYEGLLDGKSVKELKRDDVQLLVGEERLIAEFENNLIGMKKGEEKQFQVTYPEDFQITEAAGKTVDFKVKLKDILERVIPDLDDEFAKDMGEENAEALKKKVREDMEKRLEKGSEDKMKVELIRTLVERNPVDVPQSMIENEAARLRREFAENYRRYGLEPPPIDEEAEAKLGERAVHNIKVSFILGTIARKEGIAVSDEEVDDKVAETSKSLQVPYERVREVYEKNNILDGLKASLIEEKVIGYLVGKSNIQV